jgi:DNA-binding response OmpR family regulator
MGQEEDKRRASEAGFDRHFTKPVDPADLERLIAGLRSRSQPGLPARGGRSSP